LQNFQKYFVRDSASILEVLERQEKYQIKSLIVINKDDRVIGMVSDGDIRRYQTQNVSEQLTLTQVMNKQFFRIYDNDDFDLKIIQHDMSKGLVPILDSEQRLVDVYTDDRKSLQFKPVQNDEFTVIAPTRITFAGGGTDVANWFKKYNGLCINAAINIYSRVSFSVRNDDLFYISSYNTREHLKYSRSELNAHSANNLILCALKKFPSLPGLDIKIFCEYQPGSGLGGSSSLCVALLKGLCHISDYSLTNRELQSLAYEVERNEASIKGGWQDQIASVEGGVNVISFDKKGPRNYKIESNYDDLNFLNNTFFLVRTGANRSSSSIHAQLEEMISDRNFVSKMFEIYKVAETMEEIILSKQFHKMGKLLNYSWKIKRKLYDGITNSEIDKLYSSLISFGASGGKLLGAGGSGYLLMVVDLKHQFDFMKNCAENEINLRRISIDREGVRILKTRS